MKVIFTFAGLEFEADCMFEEDSISFKSLDCGGKDAIFLLDSDLVDEILATVNNVLNAAVIDDRTDVRINLYEASATWH